MAVQPADGLSGLPPRPSPPAAVREFLDTEDLTLLEKPLVFEPTEKFNNLQCCCGVFNGCVSLGFTCLFCPIQSCCPCVLFKHFGLKLDKDSVQLHSASNDCCCHIATSVKTVPLTKIQDVELSNDWVQTMFGLQMVSVQTAGQGGEAAEIQAAFLSQPSQAREAIRLAVKLMHEREGTAPGQQAGMQRGEAARSGGAMRQRLGRLEQLVAKGVLGQEEMLGARAAVLAGEHDVSQLMLEAAGLVQEGLITAEEFGAMKAMWLGRGLQA